MMMTMMMVAMRMTVLRVQEKWAAESCQTRQVLGVASRWRERAAWVVGGYHVALLGLLVTLLVAHFSRRPLHVPLAL